MTTITQLWAVFGRYDRPCGVLTALALFGLTLALHSADELFRLIGAHPWMSGVGILWICVLSVRLGWKIPYGIRINPPD